MYQNKTILLFVVYSWTSLITSRTLKKSLQHAIWASKYVSYINKKLNIKSQLLSQILTVKEMSVAQLERIKKKKKT